MKKTNKFLFFSLAFLIFAGCANNIKADNTNITPKESNFVQKETPSPAPCSNFCSPVESPKIILTPLSVKAYIPTYKDPYNKEAIYFVQNRLKEKITITSIKIKSYTDAKLHQKEAVAITQNKASMVKSSLVALGIDENLITANGMGHDPEAYKCRKNDNYCHQSNRGTEIVIEGTIIK